MVPCEKILQDAPRAKRGYHRLSGLHAVARRMAQSARDGTPGTAPAAAQSAARPRARPHGGERLRRATDSGGPRPRASRAVPVVSSLISKEQRPAFAKQIREEYDRVRASTAARRQNFVLEAARANAPKLKFDDLPKPESSAVTTVENGRGGNRQVH